MRAAAASTTQLRGGQRLQDCVSREVVDDIFACALKKQTGVSLKYMLDFGATPIERQLMLSAQFLHKELPVGGALAALAHPIPTLPPPPGGGAGHPDLAWPAQWAPASKADSDGASVPS